MFETTATYDRTNRRYEIDYYGELIFAYDVPATATHIVVNWGGPDFKGWEAPVAVPNHYAAITSITNRRHSIIAQIV